MRERDAKCTDRERIHAICELTQGHPFYTQHLCHALWELCESKVAANGDMVAAAVQALLAKDIIDRDNGSFLITDRFFRLWIHSAQTA